MCEIDEYGNPECKGCIYSCLAGRYRICDYLGITGKRRPCPPDVPCTVKKVDKPQRKPVQLGGRTAKRVLDPKIDERRRELYEQGLSDYKIAEQMGCAASTISEWRKKNGLPASGIKRKAEVLEDRMRLYEQGMSDGQIAKALGLTRVAVMNWRRKSGLPSLYRQGSGERVEQE